MSHISVNVLQYRAASSIYPGVTVKKAKSGNTFSLKLFLCLVFIHGSKLVSSVFFLNYAFMEVCLMSLKKSPALK